MAKVIKISLVLSGKNNAVEYHRILPENYFAGHLDLFSKEIDSLRREAHLAEKNLGKYEEYIRIASIDTDSGEILPKSGRDVF